VLRISFVPRNRKLNAVLFVVLTLLALVALDAEGKATDRRSAAVKRISTPTTAMVNEFWVDTPSCYSQTDTCWRLNYSVTYVANGRTINTTVSELDGRARGRRPTFFGNSLAIYYRNANPTVAATARSLGRDDLFAVGLIGYALVYGLFGLIVLISALIKRRTRRNVTDVRVE
jgi:hypothetical protein